MKICLIGNFTSSYGQICDERWIAESLEQLGHTVVRINRENYAADIDQYETLHVDATIFFKWRGFVPEDIKLWRETVGGTILAWTFDFMPIHDYFFPVLREVDLWLGEELGLLPRWKEMGINFHYFPNHAVPPQIFKKLPSEKEYDVVFTGTHFATGGRVDLLKEVDKHFNLHVFGNGSEGWATDVKHAHPAMFDDGLSELIAKSKIMLGINIENNTWGYWSIRAAQVMMSGGFMLQKYVPGMEKELKDGVEYFQDAKECIEKIRYYLDHEEERELIAFRGQAIALSEMTNQARSRELVTLLKNYPFKV
jgi:hypothetical protein